MTTRRFEPDDYDMVHEWWRGRHCAPIPLELLPECGVIAHHYEQDLVAGWVYFDTSTPICFASHLISRPGLSLQMTLSASSAILKAVKKFAFRRGYRVLLMYAPKGIANHAERALGFISGKKTLVNLSTILTKEEVLCQ